MPRCHPFCCTCCDGSAVPPLFLWLQSQFDTTSLLQEHASSSTPSTESSALNSHSTHSSATSHLLPSLSCTHIKSMHREFHVSASAFSLSASRSTKVTECDFSPWQGQRQSVGPESSLLSSQGAAKCTIQWAAAECATQVPWHEAR